MLCNNSGVVLAMFSKHVGIMELNEADVLAILEAHCFFSSSFNGQLVVESDFMNAIAWVNSSSKLPWSFRFYFDEIAFLVSSLDVVSQHVGCSTIGFADSLGKQGVERSF